MRSLNIGVLSLCVLACGSTREQDPQFTRDELLDPETCAECHPKHYEEWSGSMHAYASFDPVFLAMNARGQEETADREQPLGDFCVKCHAPMAVIEGKTTDGLNLDDVEKKYQGITCYFCHNVQSVEGTHNNPLVLANDRTMRGGIRDPLKNRAHDAEYSELLDGNSLESSRMCGACHDIVVPKEVSGNDEDVHLERTFEEYLGTLFGDPKADGRLSCNQCHTKQIERAPIANYDGVGVRTRHAHTFPGIDVAITDFPDQMQAVRDFLDPSLRAEVCVNTNGRIQVALDNFQSGHNYPSGASQDRRMWLELIAYDAEGEVLNSWGRTEPGQPVVDLVESEPDLVLYRDVTKKRDGSIAHMFWDVATIESNTLAGAPDPNTDPIKYEEFQADPAVQRVTLRIRIEPIGLDVLDDLIDSGHLLQVHRDAQIVHDLLPNRNADPSADLARDFTVEWHYREPLDREVLGFQGTCAESAGSVQID